MDCRHPAILLKTSSSSPCPPSSSFTNSNKDAQPTCLYIHEQPTLAIIQLIEVPPPPPRSHPYPSTISSSSFVSSSCNSSGYDLQEDETVFSSYCSSEGVLGAVQELTNDDTYKTRLHHILAWRDGFEKAIAVEDVEGPPVTLTVPCSSPIPSSSAPSLKRKGDHESRCESDGEPYFPPSKRFHFLTMERQVPDHASIAPSQQLQSSLHYCPACDANFSTLSSLQQHGRQSEIKEACREAVKYGLES